MVRIKEVISRLRNIYKATRQDAWITDRFLYSIAVKYARSLLRREDGQYKLFKHSSVFRTIDHIQMAETNAVEAQCTGIRSDRKFYRSDFLPEILPGYYGPIVRSITSMDGTRELQMVTPSQYVNFTRSKNFKFNKNTYCWWLNNRLYSTVPWPLRLEGIFEGDLSRFNCEGCETDCQPAQEQFFPLPEHLLAELEDLVKAKELGLMVQIPSDPAHDNQSIMR